MPLKLQFILLAIFAAVLFGILAAERKNLILARGKPWTGKNPHIGDPSWRDCKDPQSDAANRIMGPRR